MKKQKSISKISMTKINPTFNLTPEELAMEAEFKSGKITSAPATEVDKEHWSAMARYTTEKTKAINIRLSEKNIVKVKAAAAREGVSYQTFISSLIHKNT
jgi:predicted DNA binding CopG/RHH family protein